MTPQEPIGTFSQKQQRSLDETESKMRKLPQSLSDGILMLPIVPLFNPLLAKAKESPNRQYASIAPNIPSSASVASVSNDDDYSGLVSIYTACSCLIEHKLTLVIVYHDKLG